MAMIETPNTATAETKITAITKKPVEKIDIGGQGCDYKGRYTLIGDSITLEVDCSLPTAVAEAVFVHEALHALVRLEGFPGVSVNQEKASKHPEQAVKFVWGAFNSVIGHPQVISRMASEFTLDMEPYLDMEAEQKVSMLDRQLAELAPKNQPDYWFTMQCSILWGLDYYNYGKERKDALFAKFSKQFPDACKHCKKLYADIANGFATPDDTLKTANTIRTRLATYALMKGFGSVNSLWNTLEFVTEV